MAQKKFKKANFAKLFNYNVFFGDYLQYISWSVKNSKTVDMLVCNVMVLSKYQSKVNKNVGQNLGSGNLRSALGSDLNFGAELGCFGALSHVLALIWLV